MIVPVLSIGLYKIIHARVTSFLNKGNVISLFEFGFRKQRSTEMALLALKEVILTAFKHYKIVLGASIDLTTLSIPQITIYCYVNLKHTVFAARLDFL